MRARKPRITSCKPPCTLCQTCEGKQREEQKKKKSQRNTGKLWKTIKERYKCGCFRVQVDGKGPGRLCYPTSIHAARPCTLPDLLKRYFFSARGGRGSKRAIRLAAKRVSGERLKAEDCFHFTGCHARLSGARHHNSIAGGE